MTGTGPGDGAVRADDTGRSGDGRGTARDPESRARTHLANERTFLAWLCTGISLIALGLAADEFLATHPVPGVALTRTLAASLIVGGILLTLSGVGQFLRGRDRIEAGTYRPDARPIVFGACLAIAFGLLAAGVVFLGD